MILLAVDVLAVHNLIMILTTALNCGYVANNIMLMDHISLKLQSEKGIILKIIR